MNTLADKYHGGVPTDHWHKFRDPVLGQMAAMAAANNVVMAVATIAIVGSQVSATNNTSLALTKSVTSGNTLIVITGGGSATTPTISTTSGTTGAWTRDSVSTTNGGGAIWRCTANSTGSITATVVMGGSTNQATLTEWTNIGSVDTVKTAATGSSGIAIPTSTTPLLGNCLYISSYAVSGAVTYTGINAGSTPSAGTFTALGATGTRGFGTYALLVGQAATQAEATLSSTSTWSSISVAYAPSITTSWAFVSGSSNVASSFATSTTLTAAITPAVGALVYVSYAAGASSLVSSTSISDNSSGGAQWQLITQSLASTNNNGNHTTWWKVANANDTSITVTCSATGSTGTQTNRLEADVFTCPAGMTPLLDVSGTAFFGVSTTTTSFNATAGSNYPNFTDALAIATIYTPNGGGALTGANWFGGGASGSNPNVALSTAIATNVSTLRCEYGDAQGNTTAANNVWKATWTTGQAGTAAGATFVYVVNKTQPAVSRIQVTPTKTQPSLARIQATPTLTQSVIARIQSIFTKTQTSVGRVSVIFSKTQTALSRIQKALNKTQTAVSRITKPETATQPATGRIIVPIETHIQTAIGRIITTITAVQNAVARVEHIFTKTQTVDARIQKNLHVTQPAIGQISIFRTDTQSSDARVSIVGSATQTATAKIAPIQTGGKVIVWSGSSWNSKFVKVYRGGDVWETVPVTRWTGAEWV